MRRLILTLVLILSVSGLSAQTIQLPLLPFPMPPAPTEASRPAVTSILETVQDSTVCIEVSGGVGSGVIQKINGDVYVWTVAHVVDDVLEDETINAVQEVSVDDTGSTKKSVHLELLAMDEKLDIAVLKAKGDIGKHVAFKDNLKQGTALWHVGSWRGANFINSVSDGIISNTSRNVGGGVTRDQSTCTIFPGSSGGGMFEKETGKCIGLLSTYRAETFNHYVPVRDLRRFAKSNNIPFGE